MAYKLICPNCGSDDLEQHNTKHSKTEKFKCVDCKKVSMITHLSYESVIGVNDYEKMQKARMKEAKRNNG